VARHKTRTRAKAQPEQDDALFKERKPRKKRQPPLAPAARGVETPPAPEGTSYVMPPERAQAIEDWINSEQDPCVICDVPLLVRDGRRYIADRKGLAHVACADAIPPFEFPPLVKLYKDHEALWLDRGYDMFRAGYYHGKLYQCGPGNVYGQFGSFGLDELAEIEKLGIELVQVWTKTEAWQITLAGLREHGEAAQTPPGVRWLVPLEHFQHARRGGSSR
jgi:hypothetical protein